MKILKSFILAFALLSVTTGIAMSQTATGNLKNISIKVKGINCEMDVKTISANIQKLKGVNTCEAGVAGATTSFKIKFDPALVTEKEIYAAVENTSGCENPEEKPYKIKK